MTTIPVMRPQTSVKAKMNMMKALLTSGGVLAFVIGIGWVGLQVQPTSFPLVPQAPAPRETIPLPAGLPAPVERFYRQVYGERAPVITSAVVTGRGTMRPIKNGPALPMRFRFFHEAGRNYRSYIEATFFGLPIMKANEYYVDGNGRMELPWGISEGSPKLDQGGALRLWAEVLSLYPATLLSDPNVRWEPIDDVTALLIVPFGAAEERFVVRFDPPTGLPALTESMRYKTADAPHKTLWLNETRAWNTVNGRLLPMVGTATWLDDGAPWLVMRIEDVVYNVDVDTSVTAKGP